VFVPAYRRDQYDGFAYIYDAILQNASLNLGCGCSRTSQEKLKLSGRGYPMEAATIASYIDGGVEFLSTTTCKVCSNLQQFEDCFFCFGLVLKATVIQPPFLIGFNRLCN
jgi:hypothetical protein